MEYDFDIQNYSMQDLQRLFQLPPTYTRDEVIVKKNEFRERILNSGSRDTISTRLIRTLNAFLEEACHLLVYFLREDDEEEEEEEPKRTNKNRRSTSSKSSSPPDIPLDYFHHARALTQHHAYPDDQGMVVVGGKYDRPSSEIIDKPSAKFQMVMQNEFNPGKINPIHTPVITKCLNIDTRFRDNLYTSQSSDFMFSLPEKIRKVVSMQLSAYEFPATFYNTSASYGNNYLHIFCTWGPALDTSMTDVRTLLLPDGNYSASDMIIFLNDQLAPRNAEDQSFMYPNLDSSGIFNCIQFSLDLNDNGSGSGKVLLQASDQTFYTYGDKIRSIGMDFTLDQHLRTDLINITAKMGWNLGFIRPQYLGKTSYLSDTLPDPAAIRYLYLVVNDFNNSVNNTFIGAFNRWILNNNILARIPINGQYFNLLMENQLSQHLEPRKYFGPVDIQRMHIQILDDHGRVLDINNANYSFCITFKCMYD